MESRSSLAPRKRHRSSPGTKLDRRQLHLRFIPTLSPSTRRADQHGIIFIPTCCRCDSTQVQSLFDTAKLTFRTQPPILVTSAGVIDTEVSDFDRISKFNFILSPIPLKEGNHKRDVPVHERRKEGAMRGGGGRIVTGSSLAVALRPAYTASNAAVEAMMKILAKELKGTGITANCVGPGPVETELVVV